MLQDLIDSRRRHDQRPEQPVGESGFGDDPVDGECAPCDVGSVLEKASVAGHQRRCDESKNLPEGKVPRHHGQHHTQWSICHITGGSTCLDLLVGQDLFGILGVVAADPGTLFDLAAALSEGLSHLCGHEPGQVLPSLLEEIGGSHHRDGALSDRGLGPLSLQCDRCVYVSSHLVGSCLDILGNETAVGRADGLNHWLDILFAEQCLPPHNCTCRRATSGTWRHMWRYSHIEVGRPASTRLAQKHGTVAWWILDAGVYRSRSCQNEPGCAACLTRAPTIVP